MERELKEMIKELNKMELNEKVKALNEIRKALHEISPFKNEPVDYVEWVRNENVIANDYNPNSVAPPEMKLLEISITADGYTQPIVTFPENSHKTVVDGFHRNRIGKESEEVKKRIFGYLPVVNIRSSQEDKGNRIAATIRHNRARGKHQIDGMSQIILELKRRNWTDAKIGRELGMEADEVLRLAQITGLKEMFKDKEFSEAWEADDSIINEEDNLELEGGKNE